MQAFPRRAWEREIRVGTRKKAHHVLFFQVFSTQNTQNKYGNTPKKNRAGGVPPAPPEASKASKPQIINVRLALARHSRR